MKSEKSLFKLASFWIWGISPILAAILIGYFIYDSELMKFSWSYHGISNFVETFKIPISISALCFPIIALIATNHRSEQSARQIQLTIEQNGFSNYYKHKEEFNSILTQLEETFDINFYHRHELYKSIFPLNNISYLSTKSTDNKNNDSILIHYLNNYIEIWTIASNQTLNNEQVENVFKELFLLSHSKLNYKVNNGVKLPFGNEYERLYTIAYDKNDPIKHGTITYQVLKSLFSFAEIDELLPHSLPVESPLFIENSHIMLTPSVLE